MLHFTLTYLQQLYLLTTYLFTLFITILFFYLYIKYFRKLGSLVVVGFAFNCGLKPQHASPTVGDWGEQHLEQHDFLNGEIIINKQHLIKKLDTFFDHTLNRYFTELYGLTPQQVLNGEIIDRHRFKEQIKQAKEDRKATNKAFKCNAMA